MTLGTDYRSRSQLVPLWPGQDSGLAPDPLRATKEHPAGGCW